MRGFLRRTARPFDALASVLRSVANPTVTFVALASVLGVLLVVATPPLRGPDEPAHFLRAYGIAGGAIVPMMTDDLGRRGLLLPARVYDEYAFFAAARARFAGGSFTYVEVFSDYRRWQSERPEEHRRGDRPPVFVHYDGSEGYTPAPYLPHVAAAAVAKVFGLGFLPTLYLMRLTGLAFTTAVAAYAIARAQRLQWAFFAIAMLPVALYGRAVISADGGALVFTMALTALCLNAARNGSVRCVPERSLWMTLSVLSKPPHIVFIALEPMTRRFRELPRQWKVLAAVMAPGLILLPAWLLAVSGDMAAWRMIEAMRLPPEEFDPVRKARFLVENPFHFPALMWTTFADQPDLLWGQLIGVLGWLDVWLRPEAYVFLTLVLLVLLFDKLDVSRTARLRIALYCFLIIFGYVLAVYLIFYLTWTPIHAPTIWGVQGRYFVVILPAAAVLLSALANVRVPRAIAAALAVASGIVAGVATVEAVARTDFLRAGAVVDGAVRTDRAGKPVTDAAGWRRCGQAPRFPSGTRAAFDSRSFAQ